MLSLLLSAHAATRCLSVDEFNDWMRSHDATDTVTVRFDATGVNPSDFFGTKGALVDMSDSTCADGGGIAVKVYGPDDPPNTAHPEGTLKQEYWYACCSTGDCGETWADPNASEQIFSDGSERCDVTAWVDPATFGYRLACDHGTFEAEGDNTMGMPIDRVSLFELTDGSTWEIDAASSTWNEVCFEAGDGGGGGDTGDGGGSDGVVEAVEDVTVSNVYPSTVYPDDWDLSISEGECEVYLKFDLSGVDGRLTGGTLHLDAISDSWAEGSGVEVWAVSDTSWSEDTLTWSARPGAGGRALDRVAPIEAGASYTLDVTDALGAPGVYAFALLPGSGDTNGVHFHSKEGALGSGPRLEVTWVPDDGGGEDSGGDDGGGGGGDDGGGDGVDTGDTGGRDRPRRDQVTTSETGGCGCGTPAGAPAGTLGAGLLLALLGRRRRA